MEYAQSALDHRRNAQSIRIRFAWQTLVLGSCSAQDKTQQEEQWAEDNLWDNWRLHDIIFEYEHPARGLCQGAFVRGYLFAESIFVQKLQEAMNIHLDFEVLYLGKLIYLKQQQKQQLFYDFFNFLCFVLDPILLKI